MIAKFKSIKQAEDYLEETYRNKVIELTYFTSFEQKTHVGKVENISVSVISNPYTIVICFNDGKRFEVDKDEFAELVKKLN